MNSTQPNSWNDDDDINIFVVDVVNVAKGSKYDEVKVLISLIQSKLSLPFNQPTITTHFNEEVAFAFFQHLLIMYESEGGVSEWISIRNSNS